MMRKAVIALVMVTIFLMPLLAFPVTMSAFTAVAIDTTTTASMWGGTTGGDQDCIYFVNGRWWVITDNGTDLAYWSSADDGATWTAGNTLLAGIDSSKNMHTSIWVDSENISYAYGDNTGAGGGPIVYRKARLNGDGTISWYAAEQTPVAGVAGDYHKRPSVFEDSNGAVHIIWFDNGGTNTTRISTSTTNDGTWTSAGAHSEVPGLPDATRIYQRLPTESGGGYYIAATSSTRLGKGNFWNGSAWTGVESIGASGGVGMYCNLDMVIGSDNIVYAAWYDFPSAAPTYNYFFSQRSVAGVWSATTDLGFMSTYAKQPSLTMLENGNLVYCGTYTSGNYIKYKIRISGTWDTSWSNIGSTTANIQQFTCVKENGEGSHFGTAKLTGGGSPYTIRFERIDNPTCTTREAFNVGVTRSTLRGTKGTIYGTTEIPEYRFQHGLTAAYGDNTTWTSFGTSAYGSLQITGLTAGTTYHYRAQIRTSFGIGSGSDVDFTTYTTAGSPDNILAIPVSATEIGVSWTVGAGATESILRYQTGDFPIDYTDGTLAYQGSLSSCTIDDLTPGATYYFRVWGFETPTYYSDNYEEDICTTLAGTTSGPSGVEPWDGTIPATDRVDEAPFYDVIDWAATYMNFTTNALLLFMFMVVAIMLTITVAVFSRGSMLLTTAVSTVVMVVGVTQHIVPFWMLLISFILSIVISHQRSQQAA